MRIVDKKFTRQTAMALKSQALAAAAAGDVQLDFEGVESVDSSAVAVVMAWIRRLQAQNLTPVLKNVPSKMTSLMELYGVSELLEGYVAK